MGQRGTGAAELNNDDASKLEPTRQLSVLMAQTEHALELADRISTLTSDQRIAQPAQDVAEVLSAAMASAVTLGPQTERLRVALMGRSKAGKTNLVAALAGDREAAGVGVGRQRTTREPRTTELEGFDLIDLPGVGALEGERDTATARGVAAEADAVLWLYAESLQQTEADELENLLRQGKPVVVAFNAKRKVDEPTKRRVFAKTPGLAFRDLDSHRERVAQIADRAGTQVPLFVAVHARAAWWGIRDNDAFLTTASRLSDLREACESALTARATVLQLRAQYERPRLKLDELGGAARVTAPLLMSAQHGLEERIDRESVALTRTLEAARSDADADLSAVYEKARRGVQKWVRKHIKDDVDAINIAWARYVDDVGFDRVTDRYSYRVDEELKRSRVNLATAERIEHDLALASHLTGSKDHRLRGRVLSGLRILGRAGMSLVRSFGIERGIAALMARIGSRGSPAGWVLLATEGLAGLSEGVRHELAARRVRADLWADDQLAACRSELQAAYAIVAARLDAAHSAIASEIERQRRDAHTALRISRALGSELGRLTADVDAAVTQCDEQLVRALLEHEGLSDMVVAVDRVPNQQTTVSFGDRGGHVEALSKLRDHLAPELVKVSGRLRGLTVKWK